MNLAESVPAKSEDIERYVSKIIAPAGVSASVLCAFGEVDRAEFVPNRSKEEAYTNHILHVKGDSNELTSVMSTISEPMLVAKMIDLLELGGHERVLEIGTATGYQAAVLSRLAAEVDTIEIDPTLAEWAAENLRRGGYFNVNVHTGDGAKGVKKRSPFDVIIVTAALRGVTKPLFDQLANGGRIVAPIGPDPNECTLKVITKLSNRKRNTRDVKPVRFVPLISDVRGAWSASGLEKLRRDQERDDLELRMFMEERRKKLKEHLSTRWADQGVDFDEGIKTIGHGVLQALRSAKNPTSEEATLDVMGLVFAAYNRMPKPKEV